MDWGVWAIVMGTGFIAGLVVDIPNPMPIVSAVAVSAGIICYRIKERR